MDIFRLEGVRSLFVPELYWRNPYNMLKLPVCATPREVRVRREDIAASFHCGEGCSEFSRLSPSGTDVSESIVEEYFELLKDPVKRLFYWFFWFWPIGDARIDSEVEYLCCCDAEKRRGALGNWYEFYQDDDTRGMISRHNLAVYYHVLALLQELSRSDGAFNAEECDHNWKSAIKYWDKVADDDRFWEYFDSKVKELDDPQITSGMVRNLRHDFPLGFDQINAELFKKCACDADWDSARRQIDYMNASQRGLDDVDATLGELVNAMFKRFEEYKQRILNKVDDAPNEGLKIADSVAKSARRRLEVLAMISSRDSMDYRSMSDDVAVLMLRCQIAYAKCTDDWQPCVGTLELASEFALSEHCQKRIEKNLATVRNNAEEALIDEFNAEVGEDILNAEDELEEDPESGLDKAIDIVEREWEIREKANEFEQKLESFSSDEFMDRIAGIVLSCIVAYANKTNDLEPCIYPLESALAMATGDEMLDRIQESLTAIKDDYAKIQMTEYLKDEHTFLSNSVTEARRAAKSGMRLADEILNRAGGIASSVRDIAKRASAKAFGHSNEIIPNLMDDFALAALACQIEYTKIDEDWDAAIRVLKRAYDLAKGNATKGRLRDNIKICETNLSRKQLRSVCWVCKKNKPDSSSSPVIDMCGEIERTGKFGPATKWKTTKIVVPRCRECVENDKREFNRLKKECEELEEEMRSLEGTLRFHLFHTKTAQEEHDRLTQAIRERKEGMGKHTDYNWRFNEYPEIKELRSKGWELGETPTNYSHMMGRFLR